MNLSLIVLYVADLQRSRGFYAALGLDLIEEQHDAGPVHFSAQLDAGLVIELYPAGRRPVTRTRLGFDVADARETVEALRAAGFTVERGVVVDPDGNRIELRQAAWDGSSDLPDYLTEEPDDAEKARIEFLLSRSPIRTGVPFDEVEERRRSAADAAVWEAMSDAERARWQARVSNATPWLKKLNARVFKHPDLLK